MNRNAIHQSVVVLKQQKFENSDSPFAAKASTLWKRVSKGHLYILFMFHISHFNLLLQVKSILQSFHSAPFIPVAQDSSMLTVLLLLSKYRLKNVPVIEVGKPYVKNFITQSAVVQGLNKCKGCNWFDFIAARPLSDFGLPFMSRNEVISQLQLFTVGHIVMLSFFYGNIISI